jgi:predicted RNA-binding Zn-ribbon protein involved in translation (DUF1610 family)
MAGEQEDPYFKALVAGPKFCVACGREVEVTPDGYANHKCPPASESARKAADVRHRSGVIQRQGFSDRLADGFSMLVEDDHGR